MSAVKFSKITLENEEKFRVNGKIVEIEAWGERTPEGILFSFSDIQRSFGLKNVKVKKVDEKMILRNKKTREKFQSIRHYIIHENKCFLTYKGVIHVMGSDMSKHARNFETWATKIVYAVQMGSREEKEKLASQLLGTSLKEIKERITNKIDERLAFLYILSLGKVQKFRNEIKEPSEDMKDNHIVFNHCYTDNIAKQASQIQYKYGFESTDLRELKLAIVDKNKIRKAKSDFFKKVKEISDEREKLNYKNHIDFSTDENNMIQLNQFLDKIGETHGSSSEAKVLCKEMKHELDKMQKKMDNKDDEIRELNEELDEKDDEIKKMKEEKDAEIKMLNRKLMLEEMKNKVAIRTTRLNDQLHEKNAKILKQIITTQKTLLKMNNN